MGAGTRTKMQADDFFKELDDARYARGLDRRVSGAMRETIEALRSLYDLILQCDRASERVYPGTSGPDKLPSGRSNDGPSNHLRDTSLDNLLRFRIVPDLRFLTREADRASRRIVHALRGTGNPTEPKLSEVERAQLARRKQKGESPSKLAREYGVSRAMVYKYGRKPSNVFDAPESEASE